MAIEFSDGVTSVDVIINTSDYKLATKEIVTLSLNIMNASGLGGGYPNSTNIEIFDLSDSPDVVYIPYKKLEKEGE